MVQMNVEEIENVIGRVLAHTKTSLLNVQESKVPHYYDLGLERTYKYYYNGTEVSSTKVLYKINNTKNVKLNENRYINFKGTLVDAIKDNIINPFILFLDNQMIDFDRITLITDARYTYIEIADCHITHFNLGSSKSNINKIYLPYIPKGFKDIKINISPPEAISRMKLNSVVVDNDIIIDSKIFKDENILDLVLLNSISNLTISSKITSLFDFNPVCKCILIPENDVDIDRISNVQNIDKQYDFIFANGKYYSVNEFNSSSFLLNGIGIKVNTKFSIDIKEGKTVNKIIDLNQDVEYKTFKNTVFTFNNGYLDDNIIDYQNNIFRSNNNKDLVYKSFFFKENEALDNITKYSKMSNYISDIKNNIAHMNVADIINPLDYEFTHGMDKTDRIYSVIESICKHNSYLLQEYIDSKSNIEVKYYTGERIKYLSSMDEFDNYTFSVSRYIKGQKMQDIIVFRNGLLYDNLTYTDNDIEINIGSDIQDNDYIEIMIFKYIYNNDIKLIINDDNRTQLITNYIPFKDLYLLSYDIDNHIYKHIPKKDELQYSVENSLEYIGNGEVKIITPVYYDNHPVSLSSGRKFIHEKYTIKDDELKIKDLYKILLPDTFRYCINRNQFMMFHNNRKISNSDAYVCLNKWNLPFDKRFIHLNKKCLPGDVIDIYYVPDEVSEVYFSDIITDKGYIEIDKTKLGYNFDSINSSIFVNGKRVPDKFVDSISTDTVRITQDINTLKNISVIKHITYTDEVFDIIRAIKSEWDSMVSGLSETELDDIFNFNVLLQDTEPDLRDNIYAKKMVLYEIVRRYWLIANRKVRVENPMFNIQDIDGQLVLPLNSTYKGIDIVKILEDGIMDDSMIINVGGVPSIPIDSNTSIIYQKLNTPTYQEYFQDGVAIIPSDSNKTFDNIDHIIDILINEGVLQADTMNNVTIDSLIEYLLAYGTTVGLPVYNSIDASIIRPYFYEPDITIKSNIPDIYPIPIDSEFDQIMDLPEIFDTSQLTPINTTTLRYKGSITIKL